MGELHASLDGHRSEGAPLASPGDPHAGLERQALGRPLSDAEKAFADALEDIFAAGTHNFDAVARQLSERRLPAPNSRETAWSVDLLTRELSLINASLDKAYAAGGRGA